MMRVCVFSKKESVMSPAPSGKKNKVTSLLATLIRILMASTATSSSSVPFSSNVVLSPLPEVADSFFDYFPYSILVGSAFLESLC